MIWGGCARPLHQGAPPIPVAKEPYIRVSLSDHFKSATLQFPTSYELHLEEATYILDKSIGTLQVKKDSRYLTIQNKKRNFQIKLPTKIAFIPRSPEGHFIWNDHTFPGTLELNVTADHQIAINILPLEKYLEGVIPWEIPTNNPEYRQAILSQVIAARSYAFFRLENPQSPLFHIYSNVRDQVYGGMDRTSEIVYHAIRESRGQVLFENGKILKARYHSTCGSILNETNASGRQGLTPRRDISPKNIYNCEISPFYRWIEIRTPQMILTNLYRNRLISPSTYNEYLRKGGHLKLIIDQRNISGYIGKLTIHIGSRKFDFSGYQIRKILADTLGNPLPSRLFFLIQNPQNQNKFYIIGAGYGHGKGMCQWGAIGMALQGYQFKDILHFYYPHAQLRKIY